MDNTTDTEQDDLIGMYMLGLHDGIWKFGDRVENVSDFFDEELEAEVLERARAARDGDWSHPQDEPNSVE